MAARASPARKVGPLATRGGMRLGALLWSSPCALLKADSSMIADPLRRRPGPLPSHVLTPPLAGFFFPWTALPIAVDFAPGANNREGQLK
jgi:hypothetical protein